MTKTTIIVAGGKGARMQSTIPKQFIEIQGKPILMHTLEIFYKYDVNQEIVLVLPEEQVHFWKELCKKHAFTLKHKIVNGGESRFFSVKNALDTINTPCLIAIHDGVRPFVSIETIKRCFEEAEKTGAVIPVINIIDSIRQLDESGSKSVDRTLYKQVQTPQIFKSDLLKSAYEQKFSELFTDDASVVEATGAKIHLVEGNRENIKITTDFDLKIAEILLKNYINE